MNKYTKFDHLSMFQTPKLRYESLTDNIYYKSENHSSMTVFKHCVYDLNRNQHVEFELPSMFQS